MSPKSLLPRWLKRLPVCAVLLIYIFVATGLINSVLCMLALVVWPFSKNAYRWIATRLAYNLISRELSSAFLALRALLTASLLGYSHGVVLCRLGRCCYNSVRHGGNLRQLWEGKLPRHDQSPWRFRLADRLCVCGLLWLRTGTECR